MCDHALVLPLAELPALYRVTKATMEPQEVPVSKGPKAGLGPEARRASP